MSLRVGILTVSDRCSRKEAKDEGGPLLERRVRSLGWETAARGLVPDEVSRIRAALKRWSAGPAALDVVLTTGGTGLGPRDLTPEATRAVLEREVPGLAERIRREGERATPLAALSRAVCGVRGRTLIVNLPGSPKGALESLRAVEGLLVHAAAVIGGGDHPRKTR